MQSNLHQLKYTHNIMKFKQVKLSEVANLFAGYPFKGNNYSDKGVRVVRGDNVTIGHLRWTIGKDKRWNEPFDQFEYYSLHENDIVIGMDGSRVGMNRAQIKHEDLPLLLAQRVACIRNNSNSIQDYLYYQIFSNNFVRYIKAIHTGTSIPHVSLKQIGDFEIPLPSLSDQRKIAGILSALDSKIENNNKINANLEAQAQALFKSWFVDFTPFKDQPFVDSELGPIPQGWKVGKLGDIALQSTEKVLTRNDVKVLSPITTGKLVLSEEYFTKQVFSKSIRNYKIVKQGAFAYNPARVNIGSLGMNEFKFDGCVSPVYVVFECLKGYSFFFDLFRKTEFFKQAVISFAIGGVRQTLNYSDFALIDATIPPLNIVQSFNEIYLHLKKKISINEEENQRLAALRDTLLPKLMSGEIKL